MALRKLRRFAREGVPEELDLDGTIEGTARNAGWLDLRLQPERRNRVKVLLFLDVGGSMDPHVQVCEELFSAAKSEFRHLEHFYFHNCVYDFVWRDNARRRNERVATLELLRTYGPDWRVIFVGDAAMSPYELAQQGGSVEYTNDEPGLAWLDRLVRALAPHDLVEPGAVARVGVHALDADDPAGAGTEDVPADARRHRARDRRAAALIAPHGLATSRRPRATARALGEGDAGVAQWSRIGGNELSSVVVACHRRDTLLRQDRGHAARRHAGCRGRRAAGDRTAGTVRVPDVIATGVAEGAAFLAVEWLTIVDGGRDAALGRALAALHASRPSATAGIGTTRSARRRRPTAGATTGRRSSATAAFSPQLELAARTAIAASCSATAGSCSASFPRSSTGHPPATSLLHGDLWSGNAGQLASGEPVIFDPAVYYGDRETDLAMTELFGGFDADFYAAYREAWPLPAGYEHRRTLYNLYHVLNHLNLFGGAYLAQAEAMIGRLLTEL